MTKRNDQSLRILAELSDALMLIENEAEAASIGSSKSAESRMEIKEAESLLERCSNVLAENGKSKLRVLHHLACSGGSLVSKCISVMPNTYLLSEVHPHSTLHMQFADKARYLPSDYTTLCRYANIPAIDELSELLFLTSIQEIYAHIEKQGGELVIRDHSHIDFCSEKNLVEKSAVNKILSKHFHLINVVTIRNPVDAYLSLKKNGWVHFSPANFDEYCRRLLSFTAQFRRKDIVRYEDFVDSPDRTLKKICRKLDLRFSPDYRDLFNTARVTGDSGRRSDYIAPRERREYDSTFKKEVNKSKHFRIVSKKYGYTL
ncbi:hypothetical protein KUL118_59080 [Tenacibaculum sp. KUL118]|nr:hypothetical protein KUL118_59080 [Tenacibaculum sp. KUL118]